MSTNQRSTQYRSTTTPQPTLEAPEPARTSPEPPRRRTATASAPRTFEPTNTGDLPPMFETEADHDQR